MIRMNWDTVFWAWFVIIVIFSAIMFIGNHLNPGYLFFLQVLIIIGLGLVKLTGKAGLDTLKSTQRRIYDFWLKTSRFEKKPKVKRKILDELT